MNVVFDTNIFVSALVFPGGRADEAINRITEGRDQLILSHAIIDECLVVMSRKFGRDLNELARVAVFLADLGVTVQPKRRIRALKDDADNRILECAAAGHAEAIVTGDRAMIALKSFRHIAILSPRQYLDTA